MTFGEKVAQQFGTRDTYKVGGDTWNMQKRLYEALGSPQGPYRGTLQQNMFIESNQSRWNDLINPQPAASTAVSTQPVVEAPVQQTVAEQYSAPAVNAAPPATTPLMPSLTSLWEPMVPQARASAQQIIDPEIMRDYTRNLGNLTGQMAQQGAGSFGRGWGQVGALGAETQRQREAQVQDWVEQYRQGFENLFYNPTFQNWTTSLTNPTGFTMPQTPNWGEFSNQYQNNYGNNTIAPTPEAYDLNKNKYSTNLKGYGY